MFSICLFLCIAPNSQLVRLADAVTGAQRAALVRRPPLPPFPAPRLGATGGLTLHRDAAGQGPDLGLGLGPHPDPDRLPRGFAAGNGVMFTGQLMLEFSM